jgi:hypothetical protein
MNRDYHPYRKLRRFHHRYRDLEHLDHPTDVGHQNLEHRHRHPVRRHQNLGVERHRHQPDDLDHRHRPDDLDHPDERLEHRHQLVSDHLGELPDVRLKRKDCCLPGEPSGEECPG